MFNIQSLDPSLAGMYKRFAFPWQRDSLPEKCMDQRVVVLAASRLLEPAGLVIASVKPETRTGIIDSLFVETTSVTADLEPTAPGCRGTFKEKGCRRVSISFPFGRRETSALCRICRNVVGMSQLSPMK